MTQSYPVILLYSVFHIRKSAGSRICLGNVFFKAHLNVFLVIEAVGSVVFVKLKGKNAVISARVHSVCNALPVYYTVVGKKVKILSKRRENSASSSIERTKKPS